MPRHFGRSQSVGEICTIRINGREPGFDEEIARSTAPGTWLVRILSARSSPALPLAAPLAGGNLLADLVASIGRNDQTHHHPTVHGRGEFGARPSLYRGEDDVSEGAALHDRGDVIDEDGVGVAMILDRQSFDVSVFHRSPPSTADLRPRMEPALKLWAAKSRGAGLIPSLLAGSAAGDRCGIPGRTDGEPDYQSHCIQSDRRKSRTACWSVTDNCRNFCTTAFASDGGKYSDEDEKCWMMALSRSLVRPSWRKNSRWPTPHSGTVRNSSGPAAPWMMKSASPAPRWCTSRSENRFPGRFSN